MTTAAGSTADVTFLSAMIDSPGKETPPGEERKGKNVCEAFRSKCR